MDLPKGFAELAAEEKQRIREGGQAIVHMAQEHAGGLIIAPPPSRAGIFNTASFFILELSGRYWLATAEHVLEFFETAAAADPQVQLQAGELRFTLDDREVIRDKGADIALVSLLMVELPLVRVRPLSALAGWAPPRPKVGSYVAVSGYPAIIRSRPSKREVEFNALSAVFRVTHAGEHYSQCQWERDEWITFDGPPPPSLGTELGGMSGGPVLMLYGLAFPVIGVISEFESTFEILRIGLFQPPAFGDYPSI